MTDTPIHRSHLLVLSVVFVLFMQPVVGIPTSPQPPQSPTNTTTTTVTTHGTGIGIEICIPPLIGIEIGNAECDNRGDGKDNKDDERDDSDRDNHEDNGDENQREDEEDGDRDNHEETDNDEDATENRPPITPPTEKPTTETETDTPTDSPTDIPTTVPTDEPTTIPPTEETPTDIPTTIPTEEPTETDTPIDIPTDEDTSVEEPTTEDTPPTPPTELPNIEVDTPTKTATISAPPIDSSPTNPTPESPQSEPEAPSTKAPQSEVNTPQPDIPTDDTVPSTEVNDTPNDERGMGVTPPTGTGVGNTSRLSQQRKTNATGPSSPTQRNGDDRTPPDGESPTGNIPTDIQTSRSTGTDMAIDDDTDTFSTESHSLTVSQETGDSLTPVEGPLVTRQTDATTTVTDTATTTDANIDTDTDTATPTTVLTEPPQAMPTTTVTETPQSTQTTVETPLSPTERPTVKTVTANTDTDTDIERKNASVNAIGGEGDTAPTQPPFNPLPQWPLIPVVLGLILSGIGIFFARGHRLAIATTPLRYRLVGALRRLKEWWWQLWQTLIEVASKLWWIIPIGYHKNGDEDPLETELREEIYNTLTDNPYTTLTDVSRQTDIPRSTVAFHALVLSKEGLLNHEKPNGKRFYYPTVADIGVDAFPDELSNTETEKVFMGVRAYENNPTVGEVATDLNMSSRKVSYHLNKLEKEELIHRISRGRETEIALADFLK